MSQANLAIHARQIDGRTSVLDVRGDVTAASQEALLAAHAQASTPATRAIVLNFNDLEYLNSGGIGMLVTLLVRANRQRQRLLAFGLNQHYRQIFELTRLDEAIAIYPNEADALEAASRA
jgi:anti-sigma B factor antagonist